MYPYRRVVAAAAAFAVTAATLVGCGKEDGLERTLEAFLSGWPTGELDDLSFVTPAGDGVAGGEVAAQIAALSGELGPPALRAGTVTVDDDLATAPVTVTWPLLGEATWSYPSTVRLSRREDDWQVIWEPAVVHPDLRDGDVLAVRHTPATRGTVLDGAGEPIVQARPVVVVGVRPRTVTDVDTLVAKLDGAFRSIDVELDLSGLPDQVAEADPDAFVQVVTLRRDAYDTIRDRIRPLPGTVFREEERQLAPTRTFARALLGTVDEVTKEDLDTNPGVYEIGDQMGHGGLQGRYEGRLRGVPGQTVVLAREDADGTVTDTELYQVEPVAGTDVRTTLDVGAQRAAETALATLSQRTALVAVRISDGAVLAVANGPDAAPVNLALTAEVAPGSTFKVITSYGLLSDGHVTADTTVACPSESSVGGISIGNAFPEDLGQVPFRTAVARSCNTTFVELAPKLGADGLAAAGGALGLGGDWDLGIETFTGAVTTDDDPARRALAAFGQGDTRVSPVAMAAAMAAVARGAWLPPRLVAEEQAPDVEAVPLAEAAVADLHEALREVVTAGTAQPLAGVPGGPVSGKTGTAEYSSGEDEGAHAWFIGWQDDVAFAVFVEDGESSSTTAVPTAVRFLEELH